MKKPARGNGGKVRYSDAIFDDKLWDDTPLWFRALKWGLSTFVPVHLF
jgi:hypothetical protein